MMVLLKRGLILKLEKFAIWNVSDLIIIYLIVVQWEEFAVYILLLDKKILIFNFAPV